MISPDFTFLSMELKPGQNKKDQKIFQLHRSSFLNTFLELAAEKKYPKIGAAGNFFGPSYFVTALVSSGISSQSVQKILIWRVT